MIRFIIPFLVIAIFSCTPKPQPEPKKDPYAGLTPESMVSLCSSPNENYTFPLFGDWYIILRQADCFGVKDMLVVSWFGPAGEKQLTSAKLLAILYTESSEEKIKFSEIKQHDGDEEFPSAVYYELIKIVEPPTSSGEPDVR